MRLKLLKETSKVTQATVDQILKYFTPYVKVAMKIFTMPVAVLSWSLTTLWVRWRELGLRETTQKQDLTYMDSMPTCKGQNGNRTTNV